MTRYTLYFGQTIPVGRREQFGELEKVYVTESDFDSFLVGFVDPRFSGYTVTDGIGYWLGEREDCKVLTILEDRAVEASIEVIANAYKNMFHQDAVFVTHETVNGTFY